jgi:hypothetical protein
MINAITSKSSLFVEQEGSKQEDKRRRGGCDEAPFKAVDNFVPTVKPQRDAVSTKPTRKLTELLRVNSVFAKGDNYAKDKNSQQKP